MPSQTMLNIFVFLLLLLFGKDPRVLAAVEWRVGISDSNVKDCCWASTPEALDGNIATEFGGGALHHLRSPLLCCPDPSG
jgi:hypothetical protein